MPEPSLPVSDAQQLLAEQCPQTPYQQQTPSLILVRYLKAISQPEEQAYDLSFETTELAQPEEVPCASPLVVDESLLIEEQAFLEEPVLTHNAPLSPTSDHSTERSSVSTLEEIPDPKIEYEDLNTALRACFEERYGHMEDFHITQGEYLFICEQLYKEDLFSLDNVTTIKRAYKIFCGLRELKHNLEHAKPKRYLRNLPKAYLGSETAAALTGDSDDDDPHSDTTSVASTSSTTSKSSKSGKISSKVKKRVKQIQSTKGGVSLPNPLQDSNSDDDDNESPLTEAYFTRRTKKNIGGASADTVGAVASLATQVNIPAGLRSLHGQFRTRSHISKLRKLKKALKTKISHLEPSDQQSMEQLLRYEDLLYLCKQIICLKKAKSIEQGGTTASALIPVVISAASRVVGGATKAAATAYRPDTHVMSTIAQKLHGHAHEEMKTWDKADFGCYVEVPALAILRELFAHVADPLPRIIEQKTLSQITNDRIKLANSLALEPNGWTAVMDKLGLR